MVLSVNGIYDISHAIIEVVSKSVTLKECVTYLDLLVIIATARVVGWQKHHQNNNVTCCFASASHCQPPCQWPINLGGKTGSTVVIKSNRMMNVPCPSVHVSLMSVLLFIG